MDARVARRGAGVLVTLLLATSLMAAFAPARAAAGERFTRRLHMLSLTNQARESYDRADVKLNWLLSRYARHHSAALPIGRTSCGALSTTSPSVWRASTGTCG